ncbi:MAG: hypothetical protein GX914_01260 [Erysipelotrichia bacterium]|nr:hypothetical protein [Erysipelotrichia bacterium]
MKNKKRKIILIFIMSIFSIALISYYMVFIRGFYAESDKVVGPYTGSAHVDDFKDVEQWQFGENKYGQIVFVDPDKAFDLAMEKYAEAINLIYDNYKEEYHLDKFSKKNYHIYMMLGWQLPTDDEQIRKQGVKLTQFLDVYENSFKRWIYVPGMGWERICP